MTYNIAVIGDAASILQFQLLGYAIFPMRSGDPVAEKIEALAKENYGIIYLTEQLAQMVPETIEKYKAAVTPSIILIPSQKGTLQLGQQAIHQNVEKAIGQNILDR